MTGTSPCGCWPPTPDPQQTSQFRLLDSHRRIVHGRHRVFGGIEYEYCRGATVAPY